MAVRRASAALLAGLLLGATGAQARTIAIAGFDYVDTSGEVRDQTAEHAARLVDFLARLRGGLATPGNDALVLDCAPACTATTMSPEALVASAQKAGATLLVYGGIHKMSTLIQLAIVQVLDIGANRLVLDRRVSFRGDSDAAWQHAAGFVASSLRAGIDEK